MSKSIPRCSSWRKKYFALDDPRLTTYAEDGRYFLETSDETYDLVALDAYRQPYIPFHLATEEYFQLVADHLSADGVVVVNVGRIRDRLPSGGRSIIYAQRSLPIGLAGGRPGIRQYDGDRVSTNEITLEQIEQRIRSTAEPGSNQQIVAAEVFADGNLRMNTATERPYTDDRAPVETLIDRMIFDAAREETGE